MSLLRAFFVSCLGIILFLYIIDQKIRELGEACYYGLCANSDNPTWVRVKSETITKHKIREFQNILIYITLYLYY